MQAVLDALVARGEERGIQLCAYVGGVCVVDAWAGVADPATGRLVTGSTLFPVFSVTKGITATLIHLLVERGKLGYETKIADVWPEFGAHGKGEITVGDALSHRAGIPLMPVGIGHTELCDRQAMCAAIANLRPVSPPRAETTYHAATYGWILGETARRVDGRTFSTMLEEEVRRPLGIEGLYVGIPDAVEARVAILDSVYEPGNEPPPPDDPLPRDIPGWMQPLSELMNRPDARRACMPGISGIANARALAQFYAALLPGGGARTELLPPARVHQATRMQTKFCFPGQEIPVRVGLGYFLGGEACAAEMGSRPDAFGHPGHGGSIGFADPQHHLAVGLTKNYFLMARNSHRVVLSELRHTLGIPQ